MNLDTLIQQKTEYFARRFEEARLGQSTFDIGKFIESTIREVAGMVCEEIVPERKETEIWESPLKMEKQIRNTWNDCRAKLLATAKEKGFIK